MGDVFLTKLGSTGSVLLYSTYLGSDGNDFGYGIVLNSDDEAYLTGYAGSGNFPTENPYQSSQNFQYDAFITKFASTGSELIYSTYFGGGHLG